MLLSCTLELAAYSECLLIGLKKWFLFEEALYKHVDVLFSLAINDIADGIIRRWKGYKKLLKYLILVKSIFYPRVNGFNVSSEALNVCLRILNAFIFKYLIYGELAEILSAYERFFLFISL
jgi:hypothetical protein